MPDVTEILFWGALITGAVVEFFIPFRSLHAEHGRRWFANFALGGLAILCANWLLPLIAALAAAHLGFGLLSRLDPPVLAVIGGFLVLDFLHYGLHRLLHRLPLLWRLHRVHHSDLDVDVSTNFRHHPFEVILSLVVFSTAVVMLGIPPVAVLAHRLCHCVIDVFSHTNIQLPQRLDHLLRFVIITPDMHRIHHSSRRAETDSNYSTLLSLWDRLCGSYCAVPVGGQQGMTLGLDEWRDERGLGLPQLLLQPFATPAATLGPDHSIPDNL